VRLLYGRWQTLLLVSVFALLVCAPGWSQGFGTKVSGAADTDCSDKPYKDPPDGSTAPRNTSGEKPSSCATPLGSSNSQSKAFLGISLDGTCKQSGAATCSATQFTFDTVTLKPPKGFKGTSEPIGYEDTYAITIAGVGAYTNAKVQICWVIDVAGGSCITQIIDGHVAHTMTQDGIVIPKPFIFGVLHSGTVTTNSEGPNPGNNGAVKAGLLTNSFHLTLPKGWKCTYASKKTCP
jgi:hypothetical protein